MQNYLTSKIHKGSILIIEDSSLFNNALRKGLASLGHETTSAFTLREALSHLENNSFDLVILDLHLPDGEGEDLLENLNTTQKLKIIVYTSDPDKGRRNEWFRYGVLGYLSKNDPFPHVIQEIDKTVKAIQENTHYNILLVDDSSVVRRQVTSLLQARNYKVSIAIDGDSAIKTINTQQPDLILLDLELPDMNGEEVLKYLKKNSATAEIPVFILTGTYNASTVGKLIKQGANEFFLKPFIPEELLLKIDFWIDSKRKARESECERQLLQEYKDTVDRSSIVSKTDKRGVITFVNDKFCEISGYFPAELIGKSHNIVRHSDMPKSAFEEIWSTILEGRAWEGVVKNRRKDGSAYWVQTIINPIIDIDGQIVEFIGIRHDMTALEELKERMNKDLQISTDNFETMQKRAYQYEDAMDHTMAVMRTTNANIITYSVIGYEVLAGSERPLLKAAAIIAKEHHEKFDGSGYPLGLSGEDIHIYGRIIAIADVFDALGSDRAYKKAWELEKILRLFHEERGRHFDPRLVDLFLNNLNEFLEIRDRYLDHT